MPEVRRNIPILYLFNFCEDFKLYAPIAILYFAKVSGSFALGMSVFSITFVTQAIVELPTGYLSDKLLHRKWTMVCGALSACTSVVLYAMAGSFWLLAVGALFGGLGRAFYSGTDKALLYETCLQTDEPDRYQELEGKTSSMFQAALFSSAIVGAAALLHSYRLAVMLSVIPKSIQLAISLFFVEPSRHQQNAYANPIRHLKDALRVIAKKRRLSLLAVASMVDFGFGESGYQFQAAFMRTIIPDWLISIVKALGNAGATISFYFSDRIIRKLGHYNLLVKGGALSSIVESVAILMQNVVSPFMMTLTSFLFGAKSTAKTVLMQKEFSDEQRATLGSVVSLANSVSFSLLAYGVGLLADATSARIALLVCVVVPGVLKVIIYHTLFGGRKHYGVDS